MRVSITDISVFSPLGIGLESIRSAQKSGDRGLSFTHRFSNVFDAPLGEIPWETLRLPSQESVQSDSRLYQASYSALKELTERSKSPEPRRIGLFVGTTTSAVSGFYAMHEERDRSGKSIQNLLSASMQPASLAHRLAKEFSIKGPVYTFSTSCVASSQALVMADDALRMNWIDEAYVLGIDVLNLTTLHGFQCLQLLDSDYCQPFTEARKGINLSEAIVCLRLARNTGECASLVDIRAHAAMSEAHHITQPMPSGEPMQLTMTKALQKAQLGPSDITYINPHGTGTLANDDAEMQAISRLFGDLSKAEASKRFTGHALGASGALEIAWTALRMQDQGHSFALKNSFGFGGANLSLVLECGGGR